MGGRVGGSEGKGGASRATSGAFRFNSVGVPNARTGRSATTQGETRGPRTGQGRGPRLYRDWGPCEKGRAVNPTGSSDWNLLFDCHWGGSLGPCHLPSPWTTDPSGDSFPLIRNLPPPGRRLRRGNDRRSSSTRGRDLFWASFQNRKVRSKKGTHRPQPPLDTPCGRACIGHTPDRPGPNRRARAWNTVGRSGCAMPDGPVQRSQHKTGKEVGRGTHPNEDPPALAHPGRRSPCTLVQDDIFEVLGMNLRARKTWRGRHFVGVTSRPVHLRFTIAGSLLCRALCQTASPDCAATDPGLGLPNVEGHGFDVIGKVPARASRLPVQDIALDDFIQYPRHTQVRPTKYV